MNEQTAEQMSAERNHCLRVGDIRKFLLEHDPPDDAIVLIEQVEDKYFDRGCDISGFSGQLEDGTYGILPEGSRTSEWPVVLYANDWSAHMEEHNKKVDSGEFLDKENFPDPFPEHDRKFTPEEIRLAKTRFAPAHCCGPGGKGDASVMLIHLHY